MVWSAYVLVGDLRTSLWRFCQHVTWASDDVKSYTSWGRWEI